MTDQCATCYGQIPMVRTLRLSLATLDFAPRARDTKSNEILWGCRYLRLGSFPSWGRLPFWSGHHQDLRA